jgi:hypothetical protein
VSDYTFTDIETDETIELTERQHAYFLRAAKRENTKLNIAIRENDRLRNAIAVHMLEDRAEDWDNDEHAIARFIFEAEAE